VANDRIHALEVENETLRASKRRKKVQEDPNNRFVRIQDIMEAKEAMESRLGGQEDDNSGEDTDEEEEAEELPPPRRSGRIRVLTRRAIEADDEDE